MNAQNPQNQMDVISEDAQVLVDIDDLLYDDFQEEEEFWRNVATIDLCHKDDNNQINEDKKFLENVAQDLEQEETYSLMSNEEEFWGKVAKDLDQEDSYSLMSNEDEEFWKSVAGDLEEQEPESCHNLSITEDDKFWEKVAENLEQEEPRNLLMDNSDYEDQRELLNQENVVEEVDKMEEVLHDEDEEEDMVYEDEDVVYEDEDKDVEYEDEVKEKEDVEQLESMFHDSGDGDFYGFSSPLVLPSLFHNSVSE